MERREFLLGIVAVGVSPAVIPPAVNEVDMMVTLTVEEFETLSPNQRNLLVDISTGRRTSLVMGQPVLDPISGITSYKLSPSAHAYRVPKVYHTRLPLEIRNLGNHQLWT